MEWWRNGTAQLLIRHRLDELVKPLTLFKLVIDARGHESESKQLLEAQLRATLDVIPAYTWYASPSGA